MRKYLAELETGCCEQLSTLSSVYKLLVVVCGISLGLVRVGCAASPQVELLSEVRLPSTAESSSYRFVPAEKLVQGQEISYTVRIHNPTDKPLVGVQVVQPIPANTYYLAGSATGAGADIRCSYDGGVTFVAEVKAATDQARVCTHLRWDLPYALSPKSTLFARFRAIFQ